MKPLKGGLRMLYRGGCAPFHTLIEHLFIDLSHIHNLTWHNKQKLKFKHSPIQHHDSHKSGQNDENTNFVQISHI